ncbi:MAG: glycosyltransferase [Acidobacteriota bacterium]|nr:glycosyltransferase [Acidobacteriota bacterium]
MVISPPISIIIPNLDCPLVGHAIEAVQAQTNGLNAEIVVVGRDRPGSVPRDGTVRFVESETALSPAAARNLGVEKAGGKILLFTDADCTPLPGWLECLIAAVERAPVAGGAVSFDLEANRWAVADNIASFHDLLADRVAENDTAVPVGTLNLGLTRRAWEEVGRFDESLVTSEDFDWFLRARASGLRVAFEPRALVEHAAVRSTRGELEGHAAWYGKHFPAFRRRHPGVFDNGPTWRRRWLFRAAAPFKARLSAEAIFKRHPQLEDARFAFPGVVLFKRAWYRAVAAAWEEV